MASDTTEELERFRQQWQEEVTARSKVASSTSASHSGRPRRKSHETREPERTAGLSIHRAARGAAEEPDNYGDYEYHDLEDKDRARRLGEAGEKVYSGEKQEPRSALEHYERAVERESEGSLGDSLSLYRKAYKLDAGVDRIYKNKHFPPSSFKSKPIDPNPSNASVTVPNTAHHSLDGPPVSSDSQLIASFSSLSIPSADPPTDASPPPPCPISTLPSEILVQILLQTGIIDVASFTRLSLVCKRLAYLITTEHGIWKRICLGSEFGFAAMHYRWTCTITGNPLPMSLDDLDESLSHLDLNSHTTNPDHFPLSQTYPSYKAMFYTRPRIRFNGCYISTVNYIRPGGATATQLTWNSPVHIVTYYRYLRFFRDGTCASLLTTTEPADVVHHLTKENIHTHHTSGLPSSVMNTCLRGRWKLSGDPTHKAQQKKPQSSVSSTTSHDNNNNPNPEPSSEEEEEEEGTLHIETEGADAIHPNPKYIYKMMLSLKSAGRGGGTRNNKLTWMGYWSYNKLTDDWAEFGLKNDKAYLWSRVRSYGNGE